MKPVTIDFLKRFYNSFAKELHSYADYLDELDDIKEINRVDSLLNKLCDIADLIYETITIGDRAGMKYFMYFDIIKVNFIIDYTILQIEIPLQDFCQN